MIKITKKTSKKKKTTTKNILKKRSTKKTTKKLSKKASKKTIKTTSKTTKKSNKFKNKNPKNKKNIKNTKNHKKIIAFFDVDGTLVKTDTPYFYLKEMFKRRMIPFYVLPYFLYLSYMYSIDKFDFKKKFEGYKIKFLEGLDKDEIEKLAYQIFDKSIKQHVSKKMMMIINAHKKEGHKVVLLTNSPKITIKPLADYVGAYDSLTSEFEVKNNKFTGYFSKILYGKEKFIEAEKFCEKHKASLKDAYFYTDSYNDNALMLKVGNPIAVSPDKKLKKEAIKNNWRIIKI